MAGARSLVTHDCDRHRSWVVDSEDSEDSELVELTRGNIGVTIPESPQHLALIHDKTKGLAELEGNISKNLTTATM